jgi:hypothetical protein
MKTFSLAQNLKSANENAAKGLPISVSIEWAESFEIQKFRKNIVLLVTNFTFYKNIKMQILKDSIPIVSFLSQK